MTSNFENGATPVTAAGKCETTSSRRLSTADRRDAILDLLRETPNRSKTDIRGALGIAKDTCSKDVRILKSSGAISGIREYVVEPTGWLVINCDRDTPKTSIEAVKRLLIENRICGRACYTSGRDILALVTVQVPTDTEQYQTLVESLVKLPGITPATLHKLGPIINEIE